MVRTTDSGLIPHMFNFMLRPLVLFVKNSQRHISHEKTTFFSNGLFLAGINGLEIYNSSSNALKNSQFLYFSGNES